MVFQKEKLVDYSSSQKQAFNLKSTQYNILIQKFIRIGNILQAWSSHLKKFRRIRNAECQKLTLVFYLKKSYHMNNFLPSSTNDEYLQLHNTE